MATISEIKDSFLVLLILNIIIWQYYNTTSIQRKYNLNYNIILIYK